MGVNMQMGKISLLVVVLSVVGMADSFAQCSCRVTTPRNLSLTRYAYQYGNWSVVGGFPNSQGVLLWYIEPRFGWGWTSDHREWEMGWVDPDYLRCSRFCPRLDRHGFSQRFSDNREPESRR